MKDELITSQTAKLAKEKGFIPNQKETYYNPVSGFTKYEEVPPTRSLIQNWLREVHDILLYVDPKSHHYFQYHIITNDDEIISSFRSNNWEETLEEGLIEALKLIKQ